AAMFDDLLEMKSVGSNKDLHVCAMFFGPLLTDTFFARLNASTPFPEDIIFRFLHADSNPTILIESIRNNSVIFPSEKKMLILSGHGNGWKGLLPNLQTWKRYLKKGIALPYGKIEPNLQQLEACYWQTLEAIRARFRPEDDYRGSPFDLVAFDACKMANIEALALFADNVPCIVASEAPEPGTGYPYDRILGKLADHPGMDSGEMAKHIVASVTDFYESADDPGLSKMLTQSVFNGTHLPGLCERIGALSRALCSSMNEKACQIVNECMHNTYSFGGGFLDLIGLALNLESAWISREVTLKARSLTDYYEHSGVVVYKQVAGGKELPNGLSIYAPDPYEFSPDYLHLLPSLPGDFLYWKQFLEMYHTWSVRR
ncbi:MAG: clostripain-related cysteine peptidase, partial [Bacteroidales bacterium]|nr:clostripain-related cysteine peptidase [Bacteroidales bacterium]